MNKAILVGNVGKDPEVREFKNEKGEVVSKVANFTLATSETWKDNGEKKEETQWHNIVVWRGLASVAEKYVRKGTTLSIEGKIVTRSYDDKDGNKKYVTEIVAKEMKMIGSKPQGDNITPQVASNEPINNQQAEEDNLPF